MSEVFQMTCTQNKTIGTFMQVQEDKRAAYRLREPPLRIRILLATPLLVLTPPLNRSDVSRKLVDEVDCAVVVVEMMCRITGIVLASIDWKSGIISYWYCQVIFLLFLISGEGGSNGAEAFNLPISMYIIWLHPLTFDLRSEAVLTVDWRTGFQDEAIHD